MAYNNYQQNYPQQGGGYQPQQGGYPQQGQQPQQNQGYSPQGGYQQQNNYPQQQGGYPPQGGYQQQNQNGRQNGNKPRYPRLFYLCKEVQPDGRLTDTIVVEDYFQQASALKTNKNGKSVMDIKIPVHGRSQTFCQHFQRQLPTGNDGDTIWLRANLWGNQAEGLSKILSKAGTDRGLISIVGDVTITDSPGNNGQMMTFINVQVKTFNYVFTQNNNGGNNGGNGYGQQSQQGGGYPSQGGYQPQQGGYQPQQQGQMPQPGGYQPQQQGQMPQQGGYQPQQNQGYQPQGNYQQPAAPQQQSQAPQQPRQQNNGYPAQQAQQPRPAAAPQQAPAPQQSQTNPNGFVNITEDDGELPF